MEVNIKDNTFLPPPWWTDATLEHLCVQLSLSNSHTHMLVFMHITLFLYNTHIKYLCTQIQGTIHSTTLVESWCLIPHRHIKVHILSSSSCMCHIHWHLFILQVHWVFCDSLEKGATFPILCTALFLFILSFFYAACSRAKSCRSCVHCNLHFAVIFIYSVQFPPTGIIKVPS